MYKNKKGGLIKYIVLFLVVAFLISYFNIDIDQILNSDSGQKVVGFWNSYIKPVFIQIINSTVSVLQLVVSLVQK